MKSEMTPSEAITMRMLEHAADRGLPCPTNMEIALTTGRDDSSSLIRSLCRKGHILVESGHQWRVITLCGSGREIASAKAVKRGMVV